MRGRLPDKVRIQHILDAITEVEKYITDISLEAFLENSEKRYATIKQIEIIGEACNNITNELRDCPSGDSMEVDPRLPKHINPRVLWSQLSSCLGNCHE
jgi:hypothetical protein